MPTTPYPSILIVVALSCCQVEQTRNVCQKIHDWY